MLRYDPHGRSARSQQSESRRRASLRTIDPESIFQRDCVAEPAPPSVEPRRRTPIVRPALRGPEIRISGRLPIGQPAPTSRGYVWLRAAALCGFYGARKMPDRPTPRKALDDAVMRFEELLKRRTKEAEFQRLFTEYPFILSRTLPLRLEPSEIVPLGRSGKSEPDFLAFPRGPVVGGYGLVELKQPGSRIVTQPRKNIVMLSRSARTAIAQSQAYGQALELPLGVTSGQLLMLGNTRHIFIIMGLSDELSLRVGSEIYKEQVHGEIPRNCQLIPYDTLYRRLLATVPPQIHLVVPDSALVSMADTWTTYVSFVRSLVEEEPPITDEDLRYRMDVYYRENLASRLRGIKGWRRH
jgi:hypothetical protein